MLKDTTWIAVFLFNILTSNNKLDRVSS